MGLTLQCSAAVHQHGLVIAITVLLLAFGPRRIDIDGANTGGLGMVVRMILATIPDLLIS